jgi:hypothetical protein
MNFAQLKNSIAGRLGRTNLTAVIPDFVMFGESRLYQGFKDLDVQVMPLRVRAMLAKATDTLATLPADFLAVDRLTVGTSYQPLQYLPPEEFAQAWRNAGPVSVPLYYTLRDGGVAVQGGTPAVFSLSYYRRFPALAADTDTNWFLTNYPALYLYSALIEAYAHLKDDARIPTAARMYAAAANALIDADQAERHSGSTLIMGNPR